MLYRFGPQILSDQTTPLMSIVVMELRLGEKLSVSWPDCRRFIKNRFDESFHSAAGMLRRSSENHRFAISLSICLSGVTTVLWSQLGQALFDVPSVLAD
ncbi:MULTISPECIES: hypothetical protein [unclassified Pseudomonas]|uniref:hypothetical protein n=1 Tax=unclassified Pseudomonas TaxID=196821 RepID=UPI000A9F9997|nr:MULTISPECIES: hypothetical protein [unclassified Pseudomonas]